MQIAVEARQAIYPREVLGLLSPLARAAHSLGGDVPLLVVAPWLSKRTQELLAKQRINYIDLTGNALLCLDSPAIYLETVGSPRNPAPRERGRVQMTGAKAARLIRFLVDVRPPYGVRELAAATDLAPGYVSRLLDALYREALIERRSRGPVESVDVGALLRRWASSYDIFRTNGVDASVAVGGIDRLLGDLAGGAGGGMKLAITGSVAAARLAPVTAPAVLHLYCAEPASLAEQLKLLPAEEGGDVLLLKPFDEVVWSRLREEGGLPYAAPSQVAVDCLTGNGRMPAEGEALIRWMLDDEAAWRLPSLEAAEPPR